MLYKVNAITACEIKVHQQIMFVYYKSVTQNQHPFGHFSNQWLLLTLSPVAIAYRYYDRKIGDFN